MLFISLLWIGMQAINVLTEFWFLLLPLWPWHFARRSVKKFQHISDITVSWLTLCVVNIQNIGEVVGDQSRPANSLCCCTWYWRLCPALSTGKNVCKILSYRYCILTCWQQALSTYQKKNWENVWRISSFFCFTFFMLSKRYLKVHFRMSQPPNWSNWLIKQKFSPSADNSKESVGLLVMFHFAGVPSLLVSAIIEHFLRVGFQRSCLTGRLKVRMHEYSDCLIWMEKKKN